MPTAKTPKRTVKCQVCPWSGKRYYGNGILVDPCPLCGHRVTYAEPWRGDQPVTLDPSLAGVARAA